MDESERKMQSPYQKSQRGHPLPDGANASHEHIRAIEITREAEFPAQLTKPEDGGSCPGAADMEHNLHSQQDQDKQAAHAFQTFDPHQTTLLRSSKIR